ncbi:hypothetical protein B566_EDAN018076 [Ephemera danica]|nr:hypothetical protein B566_EDAN018076 [Ephemera danica]
MENVRGVCWLLVLLCGYAVGTWRETDLQDTEIQGSPVLPCNADVMRELTETVRSLLPLKGQLEATQNQVRVVLEAVQRTKQYVERLEAGEAERKVLREDATRLRSEVASCKSQARTARTEQQGECVAKLMAVTGETQREIAAARTLVEECNHQLVTLNETQSTYIKELESERESLRLQVILATRDCRRDVDRESSSSETLTDSESSVVNARGAASPQETSIRIGNRQYIVGKEPVTWGEAWRLCKARGMWILSMETEQEQQQLEPHMMHMHNTPTKYWLFARKPQGSAWYSWECASSTETQPWRLPTVARAGAGASVRCAHVEMHAGSEVTWGDDPCDTKQHYICRKLVTEC